MKTLVIHPKDNSTDFLSPIYKDLDCDVITGVVSKRHLKEQIKSHDRIIMLGHGTPHGLIGYSNPQTQLFRSPYFIIDSNFVYLLRAKLCVCIWCYANEFVEKYGLTGFYTGMIISEFSEAIDNCVKAEPEHICESNTLFAKTVKAHIDSPDVEKMKTEYLIESNGVINFNRENLFIR
jgi:hypothetical protein